MMRNRFSSWPAFFLAVLPLLAHGQSVDIHSPWMELEEGEHVLGTGPLPPGVYLCRMTAGAERHTTRLAVIP